MEKSYQKQRSYLSTPMKADVPYCTIPEQLQLIAERDPDKEAVVFVGAKSRIGVTYKDLLDGASDMASKMVKIGIKKNDVVAIHDDKSPAWLFYTFGSQMCGAWPLHFYFQRTDGSDIAMLLKKSNCKVVITQPGDGDQNIHIMKCFIQFNENGSVQSEAVPSLKQVLFYKKPEYMNHALTFDDILPSAEIDLPEIEPEDTAAIFCSSGSTGLPKLIAWSHTDLITNTFSINEAADIKVGEPVFNDRTFGWMGGYPIQIIVGVPRVTNSTTFKEKSVREICEIAVKITNQESCKHVLLLPSTIDELMNGNYMMRPVAVTLKEGESATVEELLEFYRKERNLNYDDSFFASKYVPKKVLFFDTFPLTNSGKIARKLVKEMALKRIESGSSKN